MKKQRIIVQDMGILPYQQAWDYQEGLLQKNLAIKSRQLEGNGEERNSVEVGMKSTSNYLLFVEHPPVYTLGKSGKSENVLLDEGERKERALSSFIPTGEATLLFTDQAR